VILLLPGAYPATTPWQTPVGPRESGKIAAVFTVTAADRDAQIARAAAGDPEAVAREALLFQWETEFPAEIERCDVFPDDDNVPATSTMARAVATGQPLPGGRWYALRALVCAARRMAEWLRRPAEGPQRLAARLLALGWLLVHPTGAGGRTPAVDSPAASPGQLVTMTPHLTRGPNARFSLVETVEGRAGSRAPSGKALVAT